LDDDPRALDFVEIKPGHSGRLCSRRVRCFHVSEDFALGAQQDDAPAALDAAGELGGAVFLAGAAGRYSGNMPLPCPGSSRTGSPIWLTTPTQLTAGTKQPARTLIERIAGVSDYLVAMETYHAAVKRWPGAKITLRNRARVLEKNWE
jgi:hypothetical protein